MTEISRSKPFVDEFYVQAAPPIKKPIKKKPDKPGNRRTRVSDRAGKEKGQLALPTIVEVEKDEWAKHEFNETSGAKVTPNGEGGHDFYINVDNVFLRSAQSNATNGKHEILRKQFVTGETLVGLSILSHHKNTNSGDNGDSNTDIEQSVKNVTSAISSLLLPMISSLAEISKE